jgi:hypothetical protein
MPTVYLVVNRSPVMVAGISESVMAANLVVRSSDAGAASGQRLPAALIRTFADIAGRA